MDDEDYLDDMLAEQEMMDAELAAEAEAQAAMLAVAQEYEPDDEESSRSSASAAGGGGIQRRRHVQADEEEEEAEVEQAAASGAAGAAGDHDEEGETPPEQQGEGRKDGGGGGALSARARLLSERLGKEGTRRRRASQAEEMEALPGMGWDDWRDDDGQPDASTSHHHQQHQQKQQQKRRRLLLASLRQPDSTPSKGGGKASGGGSGGGGGAASLLGGMGGMQLLATALRPVPGVGARAKGRGELLSRPPAEGGCATVVVGSGDMFYLKKTQGHGSGADSDAARQALLHGGGRGGGGMGLLTVPMAELKRRVEKRRYARMVLQRATTTTTTPATFTEAAPVEEGEGKEEKSGGSSSRESTPSKPGKGKAAAASPVTKQEQREREQLWVNRYSPSAFPHLLSDEAINREVLRMVRSWDEFVFKRALPKTLSEPTTSSSSTGGGYNKGYGGSGKGGNWRDKHKNKQQQGGGDREQGKDGGGGPGKEAGVVDPAAKRDRRPQVRAILLCGPPGMGKTTLAHVVAQHCGYRPFEINASDDRSAPVLREKITRAMQSQAVLGDKRPNCIILDEADGIDGKTGIKLLVDIIKAPLPTRDSKGRKEPGSGGEASVPPLTRPIICICNDLFAPQLRALREVAAVFRFRRTSSTRLLQRLKTICHAEGLPLESTALGALAEASGNDVRACLNGLQLFKARIPALLATMADGGGSSGQQLQGAAMTARLSRELLAYIGRGLKDQERDLLQVCQAVFRRPSAVRPHSATAAAEANARAQEEQERRAGADLDSLLHLSKPNAASSASTSAGPLRVKDTEAVMRAVAAFADHPQVLQALHENFLLLRYTDPTLAKTAAAAEWLAFSDLAMGRQMEAQHHIMEDLHLATGAAMHLLCRGDARPRIQLPRRDYEFHLARQSRQHILQAFQEGCLQHSGALWARQAGPVVLDVLSPLMEILNPSLRAKNPDLYTLAEKATLRHLVEVMLGCGVSYVQTAQQQQQGFGAQQQQQQHMHLEMVPALDQLVLFGRAEQQQQQQGAPYRGMAPLRLRTTHFLPSFVKLVATQEAKLEGMKRAEQRKADLAKAKAKLQQQKQQQAGGAMAPPPPSPAAGGGSKRASPSSSCSAVGGSKKPKLELHKKPAPVVPPTFDDDEEGGGGRAPRGGWFQKLGTKRSTTGATAAAAKAAKKAKQEAEGEGPVEEGVDGKENKGKGDGVGAAAAAKAVVRFKYQAGYTNAVRRPVFLKDML